MKKMQRVWAGIAIIIAIIFTLQAQETAISVHPVFIHAPVSSSSGDLNTMLEGVEATTPTPAVSVPVMGTFQSAQNPLWPPLPGNLNNTPAWNLGDGTWLLDDLDVNYSPVRLSSGGGGMRAMEESGPPSPGDGGDDTNSYGGGGFSPAISFTTNDLWLQMVCVTNQTASLIIHPPWNVTNGSYDLFYTTNVAAPVAWQWLLRSDAGQTNLIVPNVTDAQGFYRVSTPNDLTATDSEGTNFWLAFFNMYNGPYFQTLSLAISSPAGASGTVTLPGFGITNTFSVAAGGVTNISIPLAAMITNNDVIGTNGIHVTANAPVAVYGLEYRAVFSAAFTGYPTPLLGTNYCVMAFPAFAPFDEWGDLFYSQLAIVATADGTTTVTIKPSPTANLAGSLWTNSFTLQQGQTYQINGSIFTNDLTGTWVTSDKPVAVFAGSALGGVPDEFFGAANPLVQEQLPVDSWRTQALSMGFAGRTNGDSYRILAAYSNTVVTFSGAVVTVTYYDLPPSLTISNETVVTNLDAGQFCDFIVQGPVEFQATQPIQVAHLANGADFDNFDGINYGDPCEILLPPPGHWLVTNTVFSLPNNNTNGDFDENFLNLIVAQSALTNTLVDGAHIAATNFAAIGSSGYYGAQLTVTNGVHKVTSSQPVSIEVYGWGGADAYGYFGGIVK